MPRRTRLQLDQFLPYRLSVLSNTISSAIAAAYSKRFGLTIPEWRVLAVLADNPGLTAAEIAARTAMDKVAVSRAVNALLARRALSRYTATNDRRRLHLELSESGHKVYGEVVPFAREYERHLLSPLTKQDRATLDRLLRLLLGRATEIGPAHLER
jgi:DNA-binding MarR family transcriptional regulator